MSICGVSRNRIRFGLKGMRFDDRSEADLKSDYGNGFALYLK